MFRYFILFLAVVFYTVQLNTADEDFMECMHQQNMTDNEITAIVNWLNAPVEPENFENITALEYENEHHYNCYVYCTLLESYTKVDDVKNGYLIEIFGEPSVKACEEIIKDEQNVCDYSNAIYMCAIEKSMKK
ncbi:maker105 [Drosophila busckii]|uniref:Maker105 n=1 Tax=Drosophila busckii TaxID=30019 RepID=A0A0M4EAT6_DROBS|nr:uncharacterized protein LOC108595871 [Drosophila busckii]ALC42246.1 maker105 [Drosophila busckii]